MQLSLKSKDYYDRLAEEFAAQNVFWDNPYDNEVWRMEHDLIRPYLDYGTPLLDVGCGFYPHDQFDSRLAIVAGDISTKSLAVAAQHLPPERKVTLVEFDAHKLPFKQGYFRQAIAGGEILNHVDYNLVIRELARVISSGGVLLVQFSAKWCLDSIWAILDSLIGHRIGYALTREEARSFFSAGADVDVTWEITPGGRFIVKLINVRNMRNALVSAGFNIEKIVSTNCLSGLVPLPWQQDPTKQTARRIAELLIKVDRLVGKMGPINLFAGNVFFFCRRE